MNYGIYTSGLGALAQEARINVISNNLANVDTPAFRRDQISFQERLVEALEDRPDLRYYNSLVHRHGGAPFIGSIKWDRQPAGYEVTKRPLDVAIQGEGYFTVRERGTIDRLFYTRAGDFMFDSKGTLVTNDGRYEVLDQQFQPISAVRDLTMNFAIGPDGTVSQVPEDREQPLQELGRLAVRTFSNLDALQKHGDKLYVDRGAGSAPAAEGTYSVRQGTLEGSSSNPLQEMVEMIKAMRILESNMQMIRVQDSTLDRVVNDFARLPR